MGHLYHRRTVHCSRLLRCFLRARRGRQALGLAVRHENRSTNQTALAQSVLDPSKRWSWNFEPCHATSIYGDGALKFCGFQCSNAMQPAIRWDVTIKRWYIISDKLKKVGPHALRPLIWLRNLRPGDLNLEYVPAKTLCAVLGAKHCLLMFIRVSSFTIYMLSIL